MSRGILCTHIYIHMNLILMSTVAVQLTNLATSFHRVLRSSLGLWIGTVIATSLSLPGTKFSFCLLTCNVANLD